MRVAGASSQIQVATRGFPWLFSKPLGRRSGRYQAISANRREHEAMTQSNYAQVVDERLRALLACAIDYSSFEGDAEEEQELVDGVASDYGLETNTVEEMRSWWFFSENELASAVSAAILEFAKSYRDDSDFLETVEAQFESDVFWADFAILLSKYLFEGPVTDSDISFAEAIEVNDTEPEEANPMYADFFGTDIPSQVCQRFASSESGETVLGKLGRQ